MRQGSHLRVGHRIVRAGWSDGVEASGEELSEFFSTVMAHLNEVQRRMLLSGKSSDGLASAGPIVCACFGVGRATICDSITGGAGTAAEIGLRLKAGTNCGSCIPELKRLISEAGKNVAARDTTLADAAS
jgi:NAD(P)H-nitrite reductase large subunit